MRTNMFFSNTVFFWFLAILFSFVTACGISYGTDARRSLASELGITVSAKEVFASNTYQATSW